MPTDVIHSPSATLGTLLAAARKEAGLTVEQVSAGTRISVNYVLALETGNHSQYPRRPFISGYVRSLCEIYRLKEDDSKFVLEKAREESLDAE